MSTLSAFIALELANQQQIEEQDGQEKGLDVEVTKTSSKYLSILELIELLKSEFLVIEAVIDNYLSSPNLDRASCILTRRLSI
eukprot:3681277-Amphidinium_carterae.2